MGDAEVSDGVPGDPFDAAFLASLSRLEFAVRRLRAREGEGRARGDLRGGRVEFADHRAYVPGDDPRFLDWAVYQRTGRLFVKEFEREDELSVLLLVDGSASMGTGPKWLTALRLAYALGYLALTGGSRVRAGICADGELRLSGEVSGTGRIGDLGRFLAAARPGGRTALTACVNDVPRATRGSRVVALISDLLADDDGRRALAARARAGDEVDVLHLWSNADRVEPSAGGPWIVEDVETGERFEVGPAAHRAAGEAMAAIEESWRSFSVRHRMRYLPLDAAVSTEELVVRWLRSGGVVASGIERGLRNPTLKVVMILASALRTRPAKLVTRAEEN